MIRLRHFPFPFSFLLPFSCLVIFISSVFPFIYFFSLFCFFYFLFFLERVLSEVVAEASEPDINLRLPLDYEEKSRPSSTSLL